MSKTQKYNSRQKYGMGWFNESHRHSLARQGIKTGRKSYAKDISLNSVTYEPIRVSTEKIPKELEEQRVMPDVDEIVAETTPREVEITTPEEEEVEIPEETVKEETELEKEISDELLELENEQKPFNVLQKTWGEKVGEKIKQYSEGALQAYKDTNISGIEKHISNLEDEKTNIQDKITILTEVKNKIMSKQYRDEVGTIEQLKQVKRVNELLSEPNKHLRTVDNTILKLQRRKEILTRKPGEKPKEGFIKETYKSIFPTFDEMLHPEKLRK